MQPPSARGRRLLSCFRLRTEKVDFDSISLFTEISLKQFEFDLTLVLSADVGAAECMYFIIRLLPTVSSVILSDCFDESLDKQYIC